MKTKYIIATEMLHQNVLDILIIGESKRDDTYSDAIFDVNGYRLYRNDRTTRGGGIMAYVSCEIPSRRLPRTEPNTIEAIHVELLISEHKWLLMANYRPPYQPPKSYTANATKALDSAFNNLENVILLGDLDFNLRKAPLPPNCVTFST